MTVGLCNRLLVIPSPFDPKSPRMKVFVNHYNDQVETDAVEFASILLLWFIQSECTCPVMKEYRGFNWNKV